MTFRMALKGPDTCPDMTEQSLKNTAATWILKMQEGHKIPQSVSNSTILDNAL